MKNTKKKLKRLVLLGVLLISSSLIMYNCQPDNDLEQKLHKKEEKQDFTYEENIDISEHEVTKELRIPKDKTTFRDTNLKTSNKSIPDIEVVTTSASRVTTADHQIYTFPVNNNCTTEYALQNLAVIKKNDGTLQYLLINYIKAETKNPNFPYHIEYKTIPNDLELVNINQLHRGDKASSSSANEASEDRKCYRIGFLPCGCGGRADGHKPSDCPKCKGSPVGLIEIRCGDTSGTGATPDYEAPPCLECAIDPDGNAPVPVALPSNGGNTSGTGSSGNPPQQYTHNGEIICDSSGACNAPQFIPLISSQTFEQKLGLNVEQINILKSLEGVAFKSELEAYAAKNNYSEHAKQQIKKAIEIFPHLNFLMKYWPKSPDEWAVIGEVFKSIAGELALGLVPGYDFVESVQHLVKGNIGQAALAFGFGIASFSPAILAKIGKVGFKLVKAFNKIVNIIKPLAKIFKRGYKPKIVNDVLELINRRGKIIAKGVDEVNLLSNVLSKFDNLPNAVKIIENGADINLVKRIDDLPSAQLNKLDDLIRNQKKPAGFNGQFDFTATKTINGRQVSVRYDKNGFPDFTPHATSPNHVFQANDLVGSGSDFRRANDWAINTFGTDNFRRVPGSTAIDVKNTNGDWIRSTWHHHQDGKSIFPVPSKIHNATQGGFSHSGGKAIINRGLKGLFDGPVF
ncbi:HNH endonuclease [Tenacibaculum sp. 190524A02b]|uniref:HNH endonuclease n=1 Tax=Tenacibaculum vairaonense TaxID=3137860 RepID=UPI0031FABA84